MNQPLALEQITLNKAFENYDINILMELPFSTIVQNNIKYIVKNCKITKKIVEKYIDKISLFDIFNNDQLSFFAVYNEDKLEFIQRSSMRVKRQLDYLDDIIAQNGQEKLFFEEID